MNWYKKAEEWRDDMSSDEHEWEDRDEFFTFFASRFDVTKAKEIIRDNPRKIMQMGLSGVAKMVTRPKEGSINLMMRIDWEKIDAAEPTYDLNFPVIVAMISDDEGGMLPIDGWHRIAKAVEEGREWLPAVVLTEEETKRITL